MQIITSPPEGVRSIAISVSVCLSVRWHFSKTACPNVMKFSTHVAYGRCSFFLWEQCNVMYFRFEDDVMFSAFQLRSSLHCRMLHCTQRSLLWRLAMLCARGRSLLSSTALLWTEVTDCTKDTTAAVLLKLRFSLELLNCVLFTVFLLYFAPLFV